MANFINPFSVVKANEFSNEEILKYWVSFSDSHDGFIASLCPQELMPKYIIGSKGCGKTHLLRYYSFPARISNYKEDIKALLKNDGYIASYSRLDGLSSMRFKQGADDSIEWRTLYNYYFELYHSIVALQTYSQVISLLGLDNKVEKVVRSLSQYIGVELSDYTIKSFIDFLNQRRVAVDNEIIDYAFTKQLSVDKVRPVFTFGSLMFEIPKAFSEAIKELNNINYIYILDEYEKLRLEWQKESLNTLVYEKKYNCTIWVGARKNGYTTRNTLNGEPIHEGHEFDPVDLDDLLKRNPKKFERFSEDVFKKRLELSNIMVKSNVEDFFEKYNEESFLLKLGQKESLKHWKTFKDRLNSVGVSTVEANRIQEALYHVTRDKILDQKLILYMFYQQWAEHRGNISSGNLYEISQEVINLFLAHKRHSNKKVKELLNKFKIDFLAQLAEENKEPFYLYSGFKTLVNISDCNPRVFLTLMKLIIDDAIFNGNNPFIDGSPISLQSQYIGINETAMWFLNDIEVYGHSRENLDIAMNHLLNFMYVSRFCDKPTETSLCAFYHRPLKGKSNVDEIIKLALNESFLVEVKNARKDKTLGTPQKSYQLNKLIATLYNLPIARRGIVSISQDMMSAIFDSNCFGKFNSLLTSHKISRNAPFRSKGVIGKEIETVEPTLFD